MGILKGIIVLDRVIDLILVLGVVFLSIYSQSAGAECNSHRTYCGENSYCGIDLKCHAFPVQQITEERTIQEQKHPIIFPLVVSIALIGGAYAYKKYREK